MKSTNHYILVLLVAAMCAMTASCGFMGTQHRSSSVVQYLYPTKKDHIETPGIPRLALPLRVGIAFVPEIAGRGQGLTERDKMELMKEISQHFRKYDYVGSIELIPSAYLQAEGSFANLDQIRTMYGIDVITLLSYDQTQFTDEGFASISYWTLIGAYVVPGEKNDTHTMVDASVYDIQSRKMLFRAPGASHIKSKATLVNLSEQLRIDSMTSFKEASVDLVKNLDIQLELFKAKIKETPEDYQVVHRPGYAGAGSIDGLYIMVLGLLGGWWLWQKKNRKG